MAPRKVGRSNRREISNDESINHAKGEEGGIVSMTFGAFRSLRNNVRFYLTTKKDPEEEARRVEREKRKLKFELITKNIHEFRKFKENLRKTGMITNGGVMQVLFEPDALIGDLVVKPLKPTNRIKDRRKKNSTSRIQSSR